MDRKTVVCLNLLLLLTLASVCSAASGLDYWAEQAMEQLAYSGLVPEDAVAAGLSRLEAAELVAEAVSKADSQTLTEGNLELLNQLLTEFQAELAASKIRLEDLRQRLALSKTMVQTRRNKINPWSEARGIVSITPGNGGSPRVFNAVRIRPLSLDGNTRLSFMLYMQNALGSTSDTLTVYHDEFTLSTRFNWGNQPINLTMGNFYLATTPFTIYRAFRQDDLQRESRQSLNGIRVQTNVFGLNYQGFLNRIADGNGSSFDRYLLYSSVTAPQLGGTTLALLRTWDDLASSSRTSGALSSTTVGLSFSKQGSIWRSDYNISGEGNLCFLDQDVYDTVVATTEFAARLGGRLQLLVPLNFTYYAISDLYPTDRTAIQTIGEDFVYLYEENPWEPYYIQNVQRLELTTGLQLGKYWQVNAKWNQAKELYPKGDSPKTFGYAGGELITDLGKFLPASWQRNQKLNISFGTYNTFRHQETDLKQEIRSVSFSQQVLNNLDLAVGYEEYNLTGFLSGTSRAELSEVPFIELTLRPFSGSNLTWLIQPRREWSGKDSEDVLRQRVRLQSTIGPSTRLELRYDSTRTSTGETQNITINYRSGF